MLCEQLIQGVGHLNQALRWRKHLERMMLHKYSDPQPVSGTNSHSASAGARVNQTARTRPQKHKPAPIHTQTVRLRAVAIKAAG